MNEAGREIAILSLGQILAIADEQIEDGRAREMLERHARQVAAIIQGRPFNKPDDETIALIETLRRVIGKVEPPLMEATG